MSFFSRFVHELGGFNRPAVNQNENRIIAGKNATF